MRIKLNLKNSFGSLKKGMVNRKKKKLKGIHETDHKPRPRKNGEARRAPTATPVFQLMLTVTTAAPELEDELPEEVELPEELELALTLALALAEEDTAAVVVELVVLTTAFIGTKDRGEIIVKLCEFWGYEAY